MRPRSSDFNAFSLVEVTLALGVAAIALLAIFGLLATGSQINHTAIEQAAATRLVSAVANDLRATASTLPTSVQFGITIPNNTTLYFDSEGHASASRSGNSRYRLDATFLSNPGGRTATRVNLRMMWPAAADPTNATTSAVEMFIALDRN